MTDILMPKATAVWLVNNTSLSFEQIADFCGLHPLEVRGIADGEVARDIRGADPIGNGQLTREELDKAQANDLYRMKAQVSRHAELLKPQKKAPRYTPVSKRQDRPDAILWLLRNHPELSNAQIVKLVGTTKATIQSIRDRTHWNAANLKPVDPVTLGLCAQLELDLAVEKASAEKRRASSRATGGPKAGLRPARETAGALNAATANDDEDGGDDDEDDDSGLIDAEADAALNEASEGDDGDIEAGGDDEREGDGRH